ncbi:MAG: transglutaminase-like domain-containing protein [Bacteroidota bacterium]
MPSNPGNNMKDTEFRALVSLLDDDDPGVESHVSGKLLAMGESVIPRLEAIWEESPGELVQEKIEDIIHTIQSRKTLLKLKEWFMEEEPDLLQGWILVTQFQYPELDVVQIKQDISRLVHKTWLELKTGMNIPERLIVLNKMIFSKEKFRANKKDLLNRNNYFLNNFLETKKGAPISLCLLYMIIASELEIMLKGILLPGYFVLNYKDKFNEFFVDVFNRGTFFVKDDLKRFLKEMNEEDNPKYYQSNTNQEILRGLMKIILKSFKQSGEEEKVQEWENLLKSIR